MKRMLAALSIVLLSAMMILGCERGDELSGTSVNRSFTPEDTVVLNGVVAADEPLQGVVQAINTRGETSDEVVVDVHGRFSLSIPNYPPFEVEMAAATVSANLAPLLSKQGLDYRTYDFFHTDFKSDGTGIDAVLDTVRIDIDPTAKTLSRAIHILDASGNPLLTFDAAAPVANPAASPATGQKKATESQ
jgi:hypothetical protein